MTSLARIQNGGGPGWNRLGLALAEGAWTVSNAFGSMSLFGDGGLYSWFPIEHCGTHGAPDFAKELGRYDFAAEGLTAADMTNATKKAAKLYGASMVGVAEVNEKWFYSKSIYMDMDELLRGATEDAIAQGIDLTAGSEMSARDQLVAAMQSMEPKELKQFLIASLDVADKALWPPGVSPTSAKTMPANMLHSMLPTVLPSFQKEYLYVLATELPPEFRPEGFDPEELLSDAYEVVNVGDTLPPGEIVFDDSIDAPVHDRENSTQYIPKSMNRVIVMAFEMEADGLSLEHSFESAAPVSNGYSRMAFTASCLAQFIRNLGYNAIPMGNDTALSVPMAVDAGLGEMSRIGIVVTPKYGPRVRLAKVLTDLPLEIDQPISFGVTEFCEICGKCAESCPSGAISFGEQTFEAPPSGNPGALKWAVNGAKCVQYWADSGSGCSQCIVACPFNKSEGWLHDATRVLIGAKSGSIDKILLKLDEVSGFGKPKPAAAYWNMDQYVHIKDS